MNALEYQFQDKIDYSPIVLELLRSKNIPIENQVNVAKAFYSTLRKMSKSARFDFYLKALTLHDIEHEEVWQILILLYLKSDIYGITMGQINLLFEDINFREAIKELFLLREITPTKFSSLINISGLNEGTNVEYYNLFTLKLEELLSDLNNYPSMRRAIEREA